ncbi:MAG: endo-1,4-beta-xylanase [Geminicoccaceae bacterium]
MASRRHFLKAGCRTAGYGLPLMFGLPGACRAVSDCDSAPIAASASPLKEQAESRGLLFGSAADRYVLEQDKQYTRTVIDECAMVTPENSMKWERLQPTPDGFEFRDADWLVDNAEAHGILVHGHALVWHLQMPDWFDAHVDASNAEDVMIRHIDTVVGRYAGRVRSWDVVNEAVYPEYGRNDGLQPSPWLDHLGPGYIDLAFHKAAEADPNAILVYNDYGLEYDGGWYEDRRRSLLDLLTGMVERGVPIHALGVQSHLRGHKQTDYRQFERFLSDVADLGLDLMITELDVRDNSFPADVSVRDCQVAETYRAYLDMMLDQPRLRSITVWGLSDRFTWLGEREPRDDGKPVRPLPFDRDMQRKPAWNAISRSLADHA